MPDIETLSHTTWDCKYHVVFIPKYRRKALYHELRRHLGEVFRALAEQKEGRIEEGHWMGDHVHMLLSIPPKYSIPRSRGLNGHGVFSCAKCCLPAYKQGWGNPWESEIGKKCPRWVVTRDTPWRCKPDNGNIAVLQRTLLSILHSNCGKIA